MSGKTFLLCALALQVVEGFLPPLRLALTGSSVMPTHCKSPAGCFYRVFLQKTLSAAAALQANADAKQDQVHQVQKADKIGPLSTQSAIASGLLTKDDL